MKKSIAVFVLFFAALATLFPTLAVAAPGEPAVEAAAVPGADLAGALLAYLPASWGDWITLVVTLCAAIAALWPRPSEDANVAVRLLYTVVNALGVNVGKAKNADDAAAAQTLRFKG